MRVGVVGAGGVGRTLASAMAACGHEVTLGSRLPDNPVGASWASETGGTAGDFAAAVSSAELIVNALPGLVSADVLAPLLVEAPKTVVLDVSNPLDFSHGFPPVVQQPGGISAAERLQARLPHAAVVKGLNTVTAALMVEPGLLGSGHILPICGDDDDAKEVVRTVLGDLGWQQRQIVDLGDITAARATETYLALWVRLMAVNGSPLFNIAIVSQEERSDD